MALKTWDKVPLTLPNGETVQAQAPVIVSASRATDIPAFYADWFIERLRAGYLRWTNPFNGKPLYVSFAKTRAIVFWSKNPRPLMKHLDFLDRRGFGYYIQYTLNDYDAEGLEPNVPPLVQRIDTFKEFSRRLGPDRVVWRFDPLLITDKTPPEALLRKVIRVGDRLAPYTRRLVFSFADIAGYRSVGANLRRAGFAAREFTAEEKNTFARALADANRTRGWHLQLATCAEDIDLRTYGIEHNRCIDDRLLIRCFPDNLPLMDFLGIDPRPDLFGSPALPSASPLNLKDSGQRPHCGCIRSKDIGEYNTCPHRCLYCYANTSPDTACRNARRARRGESITG